MNKEDPFITTALRCGFCSAILEQVTCAPTSEYIYNNYHPNNIQPKIEPIAQLRRHSTFIVRHLYGNTGTLLATFHLEYLFNQILPEKLYPLSSFFGASVGTFLVHRSGFNYLVALHAKVSAHPDETIKWCWNQLIKAEVVRLGDLRAINRMGISGTTFATMRMLEHYLFEKKSDKTTYENHLDAEPPQTKNSKASTGVSTRLFSLFSSNSCPKNEDDINEDRKQLSQRNNAKR